MQRDYLHLEFRKVSEALKCLYPCGEPESLGGYLQNMSTMAEYMAPVEEVTVVGHDTDVLDTGVLPLPNCT